jgi:DNA-binding NarL/FixJ family response regulator
MRIVLAIRESELRLALELLISQEPGVKVLGTASDVDGLLALVHTNHPDLVLLEWTLPGRPIGEVILEVKTIERAPKIIVMCNDPKTREIALDAGANDFVLKGSPPEHVIAVLKI